MKIVLCSSMSFAKDYSIVASKLRDFWHDVIVPLWTEAFLKWERTNNWNQSIEILQFAREEQLEFFNIIKDADCVLVTNFDKNGIPWYVWWSVLIEMSVAFFLRKPIFLLNPIPDEKHLRYAQEIAILDPQILNWDLNILSKSEISQ